MKEFFKMTFATMCGIILLSVITGILFMISLVGMIALETFSRETKNLVKLPSELSQKPKVKYHKKPKQNITKSQNDLAVSLIIRNFAASFKT